MKEKLSVAIEAHSIVRGARRSSYGPADESFRRISVIWGTILRQPVSPGHAGRGGIGWGGSGHNKFSQRLAAN